MSEEEDKTLHDYQLDSIKRLGEFSSNTPPSTLSPDFDSVMGLTGVSKSSAEYREKASQGLHPQGKVYTTEVRRVSVDAPEPDEL